MVAEGQQPTYKELLAAAATGLKETGEHTVELNGPQAEGLIAQTVREAAAGKIPGVSVDVTSVSVAIDEQSARVRANLEARAAGVKITSLSGQFDITNIEGADGQVEARDIATVPPVIKIPGLIRRPAEAIASRLAGHDVEIPSQVNVADQITAGLQKAGGVNGAVQSALNRQLEEQGAEVSGVNLQVTRERTLRVGLTGGRRTGPAQ